MNMTWQQYEVKHRFMKCHRSINTERHILSVARLNQLKCNSTMLWDVSIGLPDMTFLGYPISTYRPPKNGLPSSQSEHFPVRISLPNH
jgi:hypothetical protein